MGKIKLDFPSRIRRSRSRIISYRYRNYFLVCNRNDNLRSIYLIYFMIVMMIKVCMTVVMITISATHFQTKLIKSIQTAAYTKCRNHCCRCNNNHCVSGSVSQIAYQEFQFSVNFLSRQKFSANFIFILDLT